MMVDAPAVTADPLCEITRAFAEDHPRLSQVLAECDRLREGASATVIESAAADIRNSTPPLVSAFQVLSASSHAPPSLPTDEAVHHNARAALFEELQELRCQQVEIAR